MSTPSTVNSRKRPSTTDTASSPSKSTKRVPVVTIMQGLVTQLEIASTKDEQTLQAISENMVTQFKQREEQAKQAKSEAKKR
jgi:type II secretory pathway component PulC